MIKGRPTVNVFLSLILRVGVQWLTVDLMVLLCGHQNT